MYVFDAVDDYNILRHELTFKILVTLLVVKNESCVDELEVLPIQQLRVVATTQTQTLLVLISKFVNN